MMKRTTQTVWTDDDNHKVLSTRPDGKFNIEGGYASMTISELRQLRDAIDDAIAIIGTDGVEYAEDEVLR